MSSTRSKIAAATLEVGGNAHQIAVLTKDQTIELYVRAWPTATVEKPRWAHFDVAPAFWPAKGAAKRKTCLATIESYLKPKIVGDGQIKVKGFSIIELDADDNTALDARPTAPVVLDRVAKALENEQPRVWLKDGHLGIAEFLADEVVLALDADADLAAFTEPLVTGPKVAPVVNEKELLDGIELMDGSVFLPRKRKSGFTDVSSLQTLHKRHLDGTGNAFVYLRGEPGVGKSSLAQAAFIDLYKPLGLNFDDHFVINGTGSTKASHFIGNVVQDRTTGTFGFKKGPLVWAMECGVPLLVDEAPRIRPEELAIMLSAIDGRGFVEMPPESGLGTVHAKKGFYVVFAGNPSDLGARLSKAIQSRAVVQPWYRTDYNIVRRIVGPQFDELITVARMMEAERLAGRASWAPQTRECIAFKLVAEDFGIEEAVSNLCSLPESPRDRDTIRRLVTTNMGYVDIPEYAW